MNEENLKLVSNKIKDGVAYNRYRILVVFMCVYVFLAGFVFIEPSPAELWFTASVPFLLINFSTTWVIILVFALIFIPMIVSTYVGLTFFNLFNPRFFTIDIYLFAFFFILTSYAYSIKRHAKNRDFLYQLMRFWAFAGMINILVGIFCYMTGIGTILGANVLYGAIRLKGFFKDPNVLGPFLVPIVIYFLALFLRKRKKNLVDFVAFIFFSVGVLLTFSRAAWLNYLTAVLTLVFLMSTKRGTRLRIFVFVVMAPILFLLFWFAADQVNLPGTNLKDFFLARLGLQSYDMSRFEAQKKFTDILLNTSIFFGTGPGNYERFAGMATHSLFARYISERGMFGFLSFLVFLIIVGCKTTKSEYKDFLIPVLMGQLVNSFFIDSLHWRHLWILLFLPFLA